MVENHVKSLPKYFVEKTKKKIRIFFFFSQKNILVGILRGFRPLHKFTQLDDQK
jgi:hypothetical protein